MTKGIIFDWVETLSHGKRQLFPFTMGVLEELGQKYKLGLVSLAGHGIKEREEDIKVTGVMAHFDSIIIAEVKTPQMYLDCMNEMRTTPHDTAIVDDRTIRGIKIGNLLGCKTYWIRNGPYSHETPNTDTGQPTQIINSVEDLLEIF